VPVTIGLAFLTARLQTAWYRNKQPEYLQLTRFFSTLLDLLPLRAHEQAGVKPTPNAGKPAQ
jgi:hypothetical protein